MADNTGPGFSIPIKGAISNVSKRKEVAGRILRFQYNPPEIKETLDVGWAEIKVPGLDGPIHQFVAGGVREIPLELFFNIHGHNPRTNPIKKLGIIGGEDLNPVEEAILFLSESAQPKKIEVKSFTFSTSPDLMFFQWGNTRFGGPGAGMECVIKSIEISRMMFNPQTLQAVQARISLKLNRFILSSL